MENNYLGEYIDLYDENKRLTGMKTFRRKGFKVNVPVGYYNIVVLVFIKLCSTL